MTEAITVRAIQLGDGIDIKGLERADTFSSSPIAFRTANRGAVMVFKSGAVVCFGMNPIEEDETIRGLNGRVRAPATLREVETAEIVVRPDTDDFLSSAGAIQLKAADNNRLLLVAQALAVSVALAHDEARIARAFERIEPLAAELMRGRLPTTPRSVLLEQIGEALLIQSRMAGRVDRDDKPDVLWDHPELERFWIRLVDEYDLPERARAIERKLAVIRETSETITDLIATRTSHRLEWYIIALIGFEIALSLYQMLHR